ncbi:Uncharacterized protein Rs2_26509 [Raphanus sativus]|nr:Uncharacterized protein Rs2_26509 [Raphanus sativus]
MKAQLNFVFINDNDSDVLEFPVTQKKKLPSTKEDKGLETANKWLDYKLQDTANLATTPSCSVLSSCRTTSVMSGSSAMSGSSHLSSRGEMSARTWMLSEDLILSK